MHSFSRKLFKIYQGKTVCLSTISSNIFEQLRIENVTTKWRYPLCSFSSSVQENGYTPSEHEHESILKEVSKGDPEIEHKLKVLVLEVELLRQQGHPVPENQEIQADHYSELLNHQSRSARRRYLEYIFKICRKRENRLKKKEERAIELEKRKSSKPPRDLPFEEFVHTYDLAHNNLFLRFRDTTVNNMYNNRLIQAMQFGQKFIIDCGFGDKMTKQENINCAKQLMLLFGENRIHDDPFDLHFCNFDKNSIYGQSLLKRIPTLYDPEFPLNIHEQSYLDLIPKEKLIYLTPHCKEEITEYDHDAVYIMGAIVDKMNHEPASMAKAKQEKIRMMKLPLDQYLLWTGGSGKSLTLNQVLSILLDVKKTSNWEYAFRHVPRRKIANIEKDGIDNFARNLLKKKQRWTPSRVNLDNLSFNYRNTQKSDRNEDHRSKTVSISSLFRQ